MLNKSNLHQYQIRGINALIKNPRYYLALDTGLGKCWGLGTELLTTDGVKAIQDITTGDKVLHPTGGYQTVLSTTTGRGQMYEVSSTSIYGRGKFESFTCNGDHVLVLKQTGKYDKLGTVEMTVTDFLENTTDSQKSNRYKMFKAQADYPSRDVRIDPYVLGVWLGDGSKNGLNFYLNEGEAKHMLPDINAEAAKYGIEPKFSHHKDNYCVDVSYTHGARHHREPSWKKIFKSYGLIGSKHIPDDYMYNTRGVRLELLAGLLDTDGYLNTSDSSNFEFTQRIHQIADRVMLIANSLGLPSTITRKIVNGVYYWRVSIGGDTSVIPTRIPKKQATPRKQVKRANVFAIKVTPIQEGDYYGFTLDGDGLCMLRDCTVTHNTTITLTSITQMKLKNVWIVAPKRVAQNVWEKEALLWEHTKHLTFSNLVGHSPAKRKQMLTEDTDIKIINIELWTWLLEQYPKKKLPCSMLVFDESHAMKDPSSKRFKKTKTYVKHFPRVALLSATPASNSLLNLWSQVYLLDAGVRLFPSMSKYKNEFFDSDFMGYTFTPKVGAEEDIYNRISDIMLSMSADDYLELPELMINDVMIDMDDKSMEVYKTLKRDAIVQFLEHNKEVTAVNAAVLSGRLLQMACLAGDTEVLCDSGWKYITDITTEDKLWDGEQWVTHKGVVSKGVKETVECWGVRMTPNHRIETNYGWKTAEEILNVQDIAFRRSEYRLPDSFT